MMVWYTGVVHWCGRLVGNVVELLTVWWWWWSWIWSIINIPFDSKSCMISWCIWIRLENKRHNFMVNIEIFFISLNFAFSMTLISIIFWTSVISITGKSTNGIFIWLIILSNLTQKLAVSHWKWNVFSKKLPILIVNGQFLSKWMIPDAITKIFGQKIKPRSEKVMLLKFWTTLTTTDSSNSILIFIFAATKVFWYISIDVKFIETAILIVFSVEMCDFELKNI